MKNKFTNFLKSKTFLSPFLCVLSLSLVLLLDQLTKGLLIPSLIPNVGDSIKVMPKFINFVYVKNYGAAWGILKNSRIFLIILSFIGIALFVTFYAVRFKKYKEKTSLFLPIIVGIILGGSIGNLIDRLFLGYVRDFINFEFMSFPVFNFADVALTIGIILFVIYFLFVYPKEEKSNKGDKSE